jgi:hypothetical protein
MVENKNKAVKDKLTDSEKKKIKQENKSKANPKQAEAKKEKNDNKREKRAVSAAGFLYQSPLRLLPHAAVPPNSSHCACLLATAVRRRAAAPRHSVDLSGACDGPRSAALVWLALK